MPAPSRGSRASAFTVEEHVDLESVRDIALISLLFGTRQIGKMLTGKEVHSDAELAIPQPA